MNGHIVTAILKPLHDAKGIPLHFNFLKDQLRVLMSALAPFLQQVLPVHLKIIGLSLRPLQRIGCSD